MLNRLRSLLKPARQPERRAASVPDGERYYVVGDIHGRLDLFNALLDAIAVEDGELPAADTSVVLLGDLVDRGPESAGVVERAIALSGERKVRLIAGNHEEMFLESFEETDILRHFIRHGGRETILSYGLGKKKYNKLTMAELQQEMDKLVPQAHRDYLAGFEDMVIAGDYAFVHAGVDPSRSLDQQRRSDLRWIRERFLRHTDAFSHVIVHGHTIFEDIEHTDHRIGIDTGAYRSGRLTALVLEGDRRRFIQAVEGPKAIEIEKVEA